MHRLHVYDWGCNGCGERTYQGTKPTKCEECGGEEFYMHMVWQPRLEFEPTVAWRFDQNMQFQYWRKYHRRPEVQEEAKSGLIATMSCIGCCFMIDRERFWKLGGMDDGHGSWGQYGTELACKAWLSGGSMMTSLKTWVGHLFRTGNFSRNGESSWPYPIRQRDIDKARAYSRDLWLKDKWPLATRKLEWLVEKFRPVPEWHDQRTE